MTNVNQINTALDATTVRVRVTHLLDEFLSRVDRAEPVADLLTDDAEFLGAQGRDEVVSRLLTMAQQRQDRAARPVISTATSRSRNSATAGSGCDRWSSDCRRTAHRTRPAR